jgi:hypothetical protein
MPVLTAAGQNCRNEGAAGSSGSDHIARKGDVTMMTIEAPRPRWLGLNRMLIVVSMPQRVCHTPSAIPESPKTANATTVHP